MTSYYYTRNQLKTIFANVENHCKAAEFNDVETTKVRRDVRFFGVDLFTVNGKPLNKLHYNSDSKTLTLSSEDKNMAYFIKIFNKGIISKDFNYLISGNSEFYLAFYRYYFIIILDKINNLSTNKRCFNMNADLLTKVQDTLSTEGELNREGEEYKAIYKDLVISHLERKNKFTNIPSRSTNDNSTSQHSHPFTISSVQNEPKVQSEPSVLSESSIPSVLSVPNIENTTQKIDVRVIDVREKEKDTLAPFAEKEKEKEKDVRENTLVMPKTEKVNVELPPKSENRQAEPAELPSAKAEEEGENINLELSSKLKNVNIEFSPKFEKTETQVFQKTSVSNSTSQAVSSDPKETSTITQTEIHKVSSTSQSEESKTKERVPSQESSKNNNQESSKNNIHITTPYKSGLTTSRVLYMMWKKLLKVGISIFIWQVIKQRLVLLHPFNIVWSELMSKLLKKVGFAIGGALEATFLGWFINNPENWRVPSIAPREIQLPRWMTNATESANVQVTEINLKTLPEINPITLPEINPKTLPELKVFLDTTDSGRELYKGGLSGQESNLPIILFGVVVLGLIIYIGWKHELFNDFIPKEGFFSNLLPKRDISLDNNVKDNNGNNSLSNFRNSGNSGNLRDSVYDIDFIKKLVDDGNHTLKLTPHEDSDLSFFELVCPKNNNQVAKYEQMTQTSDKMVQTSDKKVRFNLGGSEHIASDKITEYKEIAQRSEELLRAKSAEYEQMAQINDKSASDKIIEFMRFARQSEKKASVEIAECKRKTQEASDEIAEYKRITQETQESVNEYKRLLKETQERVNDYKRLLEEANDKIAEYKRKIEMSDKSLLEINDKSLVEINEHKRLLKEVSDKSMIEIKEYKRLLKEANDKVTGYKRMTETSELDYDVLKAESLVHNNVIGRMNEAIKENGHRWSPEILNMDDLMRAKLICPPKRNINELDNKVGKSERNINELEYDVLKAESLVHNNVISRMNEAIKENGHQWSTEILNMDDLMRAKLICPSITTEQETAKELIDAIQADLIKLKGESAVHIPSANMQGIVEDLDKNIEILVDLSSNWW